MKLLLDENLPHLLRLEIVGHDVLTVAYMLWSGLTNGTLLRRAADHGFDALITNDRSLERQHNLNTLPLSVTVLEIATSEIEVIRPLYPQLQAVLARLPPRKVVKVAAP